MSKRQKVERPKELQIIWVVSKQGISSLEVATYKHDVACYIFSAFCLWRKQEELTKDSLLHDQMKALYYVATRKELSVLPTEVHKVQDFITNGILDIMCYKKSSFDVTASQIIQVDII